MCSMGDLDWDDDHHYFRVSKIMFHSDWAGVLVGWLDKNIFKLQIICKFGLCSVKFICVGENIFLIWCI